MTRWMLSPREENPFPFGNIPSPRLEGPDIPPPYPYPHATCQVLWLYKEQEGSGIFPLSHIFPFLFTWFFFFHISPPKDPHTIRETRFTSTPATFPTTSQLSPTVISSLEFHDFITPFIINVGQKPKSPMKEILDLEMNKSRATHLILGKLSLFYSMIQQMSTCLFICTKTNKIGKT